MEAQELQILFNDKGEKAFVLLPYEEWQDLMKLKLKHCTGNDITQYKGLFSHIAKAEIDNDLAKMRDEWERDFD